MSAEPDDELTALRARLMQELMGQAKPQAAGGDQAAGDEGAADKGAADDWPDAPIHATDADFKALIEKYPVALVDFWAPWCGPCRIVGPVVDELAREMKGTVAFLKLNVDENPRTSGAFRVQSIPTLLIFKGGRMVDGLVGAAPKPQIVQALRRHTQRRGTPGPRRV